MRFEAKHSYFKQLAQAVGYFINLPYSLAMRHQQLRSACYQANSVTGIPGDRLIIGLGINTITPVVDDHLNSVPTSPSSTGVEEHQLQCELGPVASTCASAALCSERNTGEELSRDLMARLSPTVEQLPPVAQDVSCGGMASRQEGGIEPRLTMSVEPGQEAHATHSKQQEYMI